MKTNKGIRTPKKKLFADSDIFYVQSNSGGEEYIVVKNKDTFFCDCKDFMTRRLPLFGSPAFSLCSHGEKVRNKIGGRQKFGIFYIFAEPFRSKDLPGTYDSREEAQRALDQSGFGTKFREVRAL